MFTVADMLKLSVFEGSSVLAGENGLNRKIDFIDFIEVPDVHKWMITKDAFKITTGYAFRDTPALLTELIKTLIAENVSGYGIKLGRYIDVLPKEILVLGNATDFPIISLPETLTYAVAAKMVMREVFKREQTESSTLTDNGEELFFIERDPDHTMDILKKSGWEREQKVWALEVGKTFFSTPAMRGRRHIINSSDTTRIVTPFFAGETSVKFLDLFRKAACAAADDAIVALYGPCAVSELPVAFKKTTQVRNAVSALGHARGSFTFEQVELLTLVYGFADKKSIRAAAQKVLQPLIDEDARGHMELVKTLTAWLACSRSVQRAAASLYIHRNTLRYRLKKIEELTSFDEDNLLILRLAIFFFVRRA